MTESYFCSFKLPVVTIRPFNTYGPRQSARAVIPTIISQAISGNGKINLGSLFTSRDFNYVDDTVRAFMLIAEASGCTGEVINIGSGREITVGQLVEKISSILGRKLKIDRDCARVRPEKSEVVRLLADNKKAKKLLGWEPEISIEEGLRKAIEWIKEHGRHYKTEVYNI